MANPFDQFDASKTGNAFDQFDKPQVEKPTVDQALVSKEDKPQTGSSQLAFSRGLAESVLGFPGDVEAMFIPGEPKYGETMFPTSKEVSKSLTQFGVPESTSRTKKSETAGEMFIPMAAGGRALYGLGKYGLASAKDLIAGGGAKVEELSSALRSKLPGYGKEAEQAITKRAAGETQAEYEKRARQQTSLKEAEQKFTTEAQKKSEESARSFADLGKPKKVAEFGDEMQRRITGTEFTGSARRQQRAAEDFKNYFKQAEGFETSNPRKVMLSRLEKMSTDPSVGSAGRAYAAQALKDLEQSQNAMGAELEFRKYFEQASAPQKEGFTAVQQDANRKVSDIIGEALNTHAPLREKARGNYKEFSTPLDAYETLFGKKGVATESGVPGRVKMMPTDYPSTYFKNRDTLNALREQLAGDEAAVRKFANQHAINELEGKTATQAANWLKENSGWVNEVEGLNTRVNRYVQKLAENEQQAKKLSESAQKLGAKAKEIGSKRETTEIEIAKTAGQQKERINKFKDDLNLYPEKSKAVAENMLKYLSDNKILPMDKLQNLKKEIDLISDAQEAAKKSAEVRQKFVKYGILSTGTGYGTYQLGKSLF